ncbi:MAG: hypothetical protein V5A62_11755 [Haloarculaceae archaeon]
MDEPEPAEGWPDGPLTETEARDLLGGTDYTDEPVVAVHVFDGGGEGARDALLDEADPADAVIDLVLETDRAYRMFSYTYGREGLGWQDYGTEPTASERMIGTLESYRLLAGGTERDE